MVKIMRYGLFIILIKVPNLLMNNIIFANIFILSETTSAQLSFK